MTGSGEGDGDELTPQQRMWNASRAAKRLLSNERPVTPAERLATLANSDNAATVEAIDLYGTGIVERLERRVAELLGKPAALWFPTGTMAQQAILRVWTSRMGCPRVAVHPLHHTQLQEEDAFSALSGLEPVYPTIEPRHPVAAELEATRGRLGAAVLELPMQELGYVLPSWDEYVAFSAVARRRGVPLHVDGARIWESRHHFERTLPEIAAHASSIYVSMYKGIGGLSGAVVASDDEIIGEARAWRTRYGGNLFQQFPAVVAALDGIATRLDRMDAWVEQAGVVARGLRELPGIRLPVDPPHINEFWVYADLPAEQLNAAVLEHLEATGERWLHGWWTDDEGRAVAEATIRDDALAWTAADVTSAGRTILDRGRALHQ